MLLRIVSLIVLLCSMLALPTCKASDYPDSYSAEAIKARVVDADTRQPLEGVIVTANWELFGGFEGNTPVGQMKVMETITDSNGRFSFPAWGPEPRKRGYLWNRDPQILLFKPGYEYRRLTNEVISKINKASLRQSEWNGKTIEMKPFKGSMKEYVGRFHYLNSDVEQIITQNPEACYWKQLPKMLMAIDHERKRLEQQGADPQTLDSVYRTLITYQNDWYTKEGGPGCGSPKDFFQRYKP